MFLFTACPTPQKYSEIPEITFEKVELRDSTDLLGNETKLFKLYFEVIDGDGNIGLKDSETTGVFHYDSTYYYNLFLTFYKIEDGIIIQSNPEAPENYRIPFIETQGQNKTLIATISVDILFAYKPPLDTLDFDSIMYEFYIFDRSFNKSNVEMTPQINLDQTGTVF